MWDEKDAFNTDWEDLSWWWGRARMEILHECMKRLVPRNLDILEIGAGRGRMTSMLSRFGSVKAIEPHPDAASYLQSSLGIETYNCTLESFSSTEGFDLVTCFDALEHIEDDEKALSKMEALLKDNGFLVLTVPAFMFLWKRHDEFNHHYRRYRRRELAQKLPSTLVIRKASYFNTILFPLAVLDKLVLARNRKSRSLDPSRTVNAILYRIFSAEKPILRFIDFPFGVSILLIAQKRRPHNSRTDLGNRR